jgi:hypothetical protein
MRERHPCTATAARDALVRDDIVLGPAAEILGRDLLQFLDGIGRRRVRARVIACVVWLPPDTQLRQVPGCRPT